MKINLTILFLIVVSLAATVQAQDAQPTLSAAQLESMQSICTQTEKKAAPLALKLAATVKQIYDNMLADRPDEPLREKLSKQLNDTAVQILNVKGQSIREMVNVLTPSQKNLLKTAMTKPDATADLSELMERVFNIPKM
jgi:hypothetical protein